MKVTERTIATLPTPTNVHVGKRQFRKVVIAAAARFLPSGCMAEMRPNFSDEAAVLANERGVGPRSIPRVPCSTRRDGVTERKFHWWSCLVVPEEEREIF